MKLFLRLFFSISILLVLVTGEAFAEYEKMEGISISGQTETREYYSVSDLIQVSLE